MEEKLGGGKVDERRGKGLRGGGGEVGRERGKWEVGRGSWKGKWEGATFPVEASPTKMFFQRESFCSPLGIIHQLFVN